MINLHLGNSLEAMRGMKDKEFDLCLTDPPYGNNTKYSSYQDSKENLALLIKKVFPEILRVSKKVVITPGVSNIHLYPEPTWTLCWITPAGSGSGPWGFCCWQPILVYGKDPFLENGLGRRSDIINHTEISEKLNHPCPKPKKFWQKLLLRVTAGKFHTVLDPFLGSGTTALVCHDMGFDLTGYEIDKDYFEAAQDRLKRHQAQGRLFT